VERLGMGNRRHAGPKRINRELAQSGDVLERDPVPRGRRLCRELQPVHAGRAVQLAVLGGARAIRRAWQAFGSVRIVEERVDVRGEVGVVLEQKAVCRVRIDLEARVREQPDEEM
jgi:hypothetical protein